MKHRCCFLLILLIATLFLDNRVSAQPNSAHQAISSPPTKTVAGSTPPARPGVILYCTLPPVTVPKAAPIPGVAELDPTTGLHYTGSGKTIHIDLETYRLEIDGMVDFPLKLSYDDLRCLPKIEARTTIVCKGNFDDTAVWAGASLKYVLELAGIQAQAKNIRLISADNYEASITREEAMSGKAFLAYEWEKQPVPIIHGFPVRVALPGLLGGNWVKWLVKIEVY
jgi:DMSO/TMAO reductase YedYZ molybdopterin-dependent catalytic subunit